LELAGFEVGHNPLRSPFLVHVHDRVGEGWSLVYQVLILTKEWFDFSMLIFPFEVNLKVKRKNILVHFSHVYPVSRVSKI
jgi:hypothetical protein